MNSSIYFKVFIMSSVINIASFFSPLSFAGIQYIDLKQLPSNSKALKVIKPTDGSLVDDQRKIEDIIKHNATINSLDPSLITAIIKQESNFNKLAVSPKGAKGLMQLMPNTASIYGNYNLFNPQHNVEAGTRHFAYLLKKYGKTHLALAAYNAGEGNIAKYGGIPPFKETQDYVYNVLKVYNNLLNRKFSTLESQVSLDDKSLDRKKTQKPKLKSDDKAAVDKKVLYLKLYSN